MSHVTLYDGNITKSNFSRPRLTALPFQSLHGNKSYPISRIKSGKVRLIPKLPDPHGRRPSVHNDHEPINLSQYILVIIKIIKRKSHFVLRIE